MSVSNHTLTAKHKVFITVIAIIAAAFVGGCVKVHVSKDIAVLPRYENASKEQLIAEANRLAKVESLRGDFNVVFEDTTAATIGVSDKYQSANGEIIVQRPENIYLKIEAPVVKIDIAQMTSNGKNFHVAVLEDGGNGKNKKFVIGTNSADYSALQKPLSDTVAAGNDNEKLFQKGVSAFSNLRPQHFTEALLIKPLEPLTGEVFYIQSEFFQDETSPGSRKDSPMSLVNHGYYLLEELRKKGDDLVVSRRFWFDRIGKVRLARQQIYNAAGDLESDILYGNSGKFTTSGEYDLPLQIILTRPKDKYKMTLTYQDPKSVIIGKQWPEKFFNLENRWSLPEVDLDKKLAEAQTTSTQAKSGGPQ